MKATQLRLGNYLQAKNRVVKITRIFNEDEIGIGSGDPYTVSGETPCLLPIPLTEELLLKCGFYNKKEYWIKCDDKPEGIHTNIICIVQHKGLFSQKHLSFSFSAYGNYNHNSIDIEIKHLHQLQNLYFALTGEELNIEL